MTTLSQLITSRMNIPGQEMSLDDVVEKATKAGEKLGRSNLHKLTKEPPLSLTRATIFGLARGLEVTPLTVANAALESMGINPHPAEVTDSLSTIAIDPTLSDRDRRQLAAMVKEMRNDLTTQTPPTPGPTPTEGEKTGAGDPRKKVTPLHPADPVPDLDQVAASEGDKGPDLEPDEEDYSQDPDDHPNE